MSTIKVINVPQTALNITNGITQVVRVISEGPQGPAGSSGGNVLISNTEPTGVIPTGSIWFSESAQLLSVYDGTEWVAQRVDSSETFTQATPAATWDVRHSMGKFPSVTVYDSAGDVCYGDIRYITNEQLEIKFSAAFSGQAVLN